MASTTRPRLVSKPHANPEPELNRREAFQAGGVRPRRHVRGGQTENGRSGPPRPRSLEGDPRHLRREPRPEPDHVYPSASLLPSEGGLHPPRLPEETSSRGWRRSSGFYGLRVGDQEFERKYTIKSSNEPRGRPLMMDWRLRGLIMGQPSLRLEIRRLPWESGGRRGMESGRWWSRP